MESVLINIDSRKELSFFLNLINKMGYSSRVLDKEDKEDSALLALMYEREKEGTFPLETTYQRLDKIIKKQIP